MGPGGKDPDDNNTTDSTAKTSSLPWDVATWYATRNGYTKSDAEVDCEDSKEGVEAAWKAAREDALN